MRHPDRHTRMFDRFVTRVTSLPQPLRSLRPSRRHMVGRRASLEAWRRLVVAGATVAILASSMPIETLATTAPTGNVSQAAAPTAAKVAPKLPFDHGTKTEVPELRTATSQTFNNGDGTFTTDEFGSARFFKDATGAFQAIDTTPTPSTAAGVAYETAAGAVSVELGDTAKSGRLATIRSGQYSVTWTATTSDKTDAGSGPGSASAGLTKGQVVYPDAFPATDLRYTILPAGVKEDIVLRDATAPADFAFALDAPGLTAVLEKDGSVSLSEPKGVDRKSVV